MDDMKHMRVLEEEIKILKSRFEEHGTGNLRTAVNVLERRVTEIEDYIKEALNGV